MSQFTAIRSIVDYLTSMDHICCQFLNYSHFFDIFYHLSTSYLQKKLKIRNYVKLFEVAHSLVVVELVYHLRTDSSSFAYRSWTNNHCRPKLSRQKQSKLRQVRVLRMVKEQPSPDFDEAQESRIAQVQSLRIVKVLNLLLRFQVVLFCLS